MVYGYIISVLLNHFGDKVVNSKITQIGTLDFLKSLHDLRQSGDNKSKKDVLLDKLPIRFCDSCGCILKVQYTEYIPSIACSLLGYCCFNRYCAEFGRVFEPPWSDTLILSRLGFVLRKLRGKKH